MKITNSAFEQSIDASNGYINSISKSIGIDKVESILEKYPNLNIEWLLTGNGDMMKTNANNEAVIASTQLKKVSKVPIHAQAGFLAGYGDTEFMDNLPVEYWEVDQEYKGDYIVFEVKGDSMDNNSDEAIKENDRLLCREVQRHHWQNKLHINKWDFVIVHKNDGILVKRIIDHNLENATIKCHSLNTYYDDFELKLNDVIKLYNVVDLKRNRRR
ncbi:S24 family peptidase [Aurantibacter aestuarii]|uniref:S24 family peptidase n=1 Tax=Aurantibacter aestuarii TaxID=1266046 RepID=UPI0015E79CAA|nr:S24 family peptidase [Aurantibacter aestuarii]